MIVEDNARSGIRPSLSAADRNSMPTKNEEARNPPSSSPRPLSMPGGPITARRNSDELFLDQGSTLAFRSQNPSRFANSSPTLQPSELTNGRPTVRPKPDGLKMGGNTPNGVVYSGPKDLAQRFLQLNVQRKAVSNNSDTVLAHAARKDHVSIPFPSKYASTECIQPSSDSYPSSINHMYPLSTDGSTTSRPSGTRVMPPPPTPPHPPKIPLSSDQSVPLPRAPSPAYDPFRNVQINGLTARLSKHSSSRSLVDTSTLQSSRGTSDRVSELNGPVMNARSNEDDRTLRVRTGSRDTCPATAISATELYDQLRSSNVLVIDIRNRETYDQGHIFAKNVMCIEPISLRSGMDAEELEDRLIVSTQSEQRLFEQRNEFDLVVYYDQATYSDRFLSGPSTNSDASALRAIHDCLYEFNYYKQLQRRPVMLTGGLEAWTDLVGPQALAVSQTAAHLGSIQARLPPSRSGRSVARVPMASANSSLEVRKRRLRDHNPLNPDEEKSWLEKARREEIPSADYSHTQSDSDTESTSSQSEEPPSPFVHSYDEFLKKFPEPSGIRQSMMVSARAPPLPPPIRTAPTTPSVPSRPAPAVPRPSYSGVSDRDSLHSSPISRQPTNQLPLYTPRSVSHNLKLPRTGLINFSVTCYMNATIQCLMATLPLSRFFLADGWRDYTQKNWKGSNGIMPEIYANLIRSLWKGDVEAIRPSSLRNLCARLNREWGVDRQQDAKEFFDFLLDCLHEDLNSNWNKTPLQPLTFEQEINRERMTVSRVSWLEWERYSHRERSPIADLFAGQHASQLRCKTCKNTSTTYEAFYSISVEIPRKGSSDVYDCLRSYCQEEKLSGDEVWKCPYCKREREATKKITITRAPHILAVHFKRFSASKSETARKLHTPINFPLHQLNIGPYMVQSPAADSKDALAVRERGEPANTPPFVYDCYAVLRHLGSSLSGGHYIALVKDGNRGVWRKFDDQYASDFDPAKLKPDQKLQNEQAYLVFYERARAR